MANLRGDKMGWFAINRVHIRNNLFFHCVLFRVLHLQPLQMWREEYAAITQSQHQKLFFTVVDATGSEFKMRENPLTGTYDV